MLCRWRNSENPDLSRNWLLGDANLDERKVLENSMWRVELTEVGGRRLPGLPVISREPLLG